MNFKIKLIEIKKSPMDKKKWRAYFSKNGKEIHTDFGQKGAEDYTIHKDIIRRNKYIWRHMKDTKTKDPTRAGYLSLYILWNKKTMNASLNDYKKRLSEYNKTGKFQTSLTKYIKPSNASKKYQ